MAKRFGGYPLILGQRVVEGDFLVAEILFLAT
jgi:hypothetical protein